ncbi:MAG: preprotein translocase subunit SecA [Candidatus Puniceispirillum sp.]|nr:preprotein translocase subunit SecA [Candidatus Pelagibacter sp.]MBA4282932.1 preprotein translocase subunit SecA [Candidatus Puniceispirillum sp.]
MFLSILHKILGSTSDRLIKKYLKTVSDINRLEPSMANLTDSQLQHKTLEFKERVSKGEKLESLLPEAFAVVREASRRVLKMRHFDVQLIGGMVLHEGRIAEMKTGEGKTLVATLPIYLNALTGKGVHIVTINDYLAKRDSDTMGQLFQFLGLTCGCVIGDQPFPIRKAMYDCDITYGTNHEFGFDYLRDNMKFHANEMVMRPFNYAIVDEADSILIDEARTPLIISGAAEDSSDLYRSVNAIIPLLVDADFEKDEKHKAVTLTDSGVEKIETELFKMNLLKGKSLYDVHNIAVVHHVNAALRAHKLFTRDVDYIVEDNKVVIIDEFTGRKMEGRRFSEGLHQALEAKENAKIEVENQTLASITYQNFFRLYPKCSGMTGTAMTEAAEFEEIYNLTPVEIPTNVPVIRQDSNDEVFMSVREKYNAVVDQIKECHSKGQPVLVGTTSIERSEQISDLLKKQKVPHKVLNARYHEHEAFIVAEAGRTGAVTIATNMAGRGTDIKLGGNLEMRVATELAKIPEGPDRDRMIKEIEQEISADQLKVKAAGGLYVIGTERHESRRVDNQLRGRSGRQGDPGGSKFYLSLEDDLLRIFGSQQLESVFRKMGVEEGEVISHKWMNKALENAQKRVEARNFDIRKQVLKYDDVMNEQRKIIYEQRREIMASQDISEMVHDTAEDVVDNTVDRYILDNSLVEQWDIHGLHTEVLRICGVNIDFDRLLQRKDVSIDLLKKTIREELNVVLKYKEQKYSFEFMRTAEKNLLLRSIDEAWRGHLHALDHIRQGINWRAYAQGNPLNEYKREAYNAFQYMMNKIRESFVFSLAHFELSMPDSDSLESILKSSSDITDMHESYLDWSGPEEGDFIQNQDEREDSLRDKKPARNADCPCGSGKKYKYCCGIII